MDVVLVVYGVVFWAPRGQVVCMSPRSLMGEG